MDKEREENAKVIFTLTDKASDTVQGLIKAYGEGMLDGVGIGFKLANKAKAE